MANATLRGVITDIFQSEVYGNFEKRVFWVQEQDVQYPSTWQLECHQGDCIILDNFQVGQYVECSINIRGRQFTRKDGSGEGVINTLKCWKIGLAQPDQQYGSAKQQGQYRQPAQQQSAPQQPAQPQYRQPSQQPQQPSQYGPQPQQHQQEDGGGLPF